MAIDSVLAHAHVWQLVLLIPLAPLLQILYNYFLHPLRNIPGPFGARVSEIWRTRKYAQGKWQDDILELHEQYGPVVRVSPNEVSFVDKEALLKIYGHGTGTMKTSYYDVWEPVKNNPHPSFFSVRNPKQHAFLRRRVAHPYAMSSILSLEPQLQDIADTLWSQFDRMASEGQVVDIQQWANYFAFDVVTRLGLGSTLGFLRSGTDVLGIIETIHNLFFFGSVLGYVPGQQWWTTNPIATALFRLFGGDSPAIAINEWFVQQVQKRLNAPKDETRPRDMLDHFTSLKEPDGTPVTQPGILAEIGALLGAGADTSAIAISVIIGQLLTHPESHMRVQQEVDAAYETLAASGKEYLDFRTAESLPYLAACIKEATRLCPSILWQLPRHTPAQGIEVAGHYIPGGSTVSMSPIAQNRCKEIWGDDADEWKPERFIVGEKGTTQEYVREIERLNVTFGFGSRVCIGRNLATVEMYKIVGQFVHRYESELVNKEQPFTRRSQWFCIQDNLKVKLRRRF